ncbi:Uncharacterized conserved protein [Klebsiella pneumoniae]|uniref:DUF2190 family protein n=1 Tax=Klebsiella pneumoniae TaxID=573 RepID=UPI000E2E1425|nr:capsid cement protein [Klebsiella pneumoniae]HCC2596664.1 DUF2190 family protein [Klebsiella variicola]HDS8474104.1 DUF2190 family protein [Klebsiella quasipneumoniae subsp. similipneumoniae]SWU07340.1 Uncharacterized conserved protein [Klebsiella pneumoniae]SWY51562.1 Uncharacterized conserved protein [Klebsiella pneumoniae]SXA75193.1 Uncharacterized conserved protein [Klebsiella pneumoniae]
MAKNFVQEGKTIHLVNAGQEPILSGGAVVVGELIAIAITDIPGGDTGDGLTEGVFQLPKLPADEIEAGKKVYFKAGKVQLEATDAVFAGVAWEDAGANSTVIDVKINA